MEKLSQFKFTPSALRKSLPASSRLRAQDFSKVPVLDTPLPQPEQLATQPKHCPAKPPDNEFTLWHWNVNGIKRVIKNESLTQFLQMYQPPLLCVNETKIQPTE